MSETNPIVLCEQCEIKPATLQCTLCKTSVQKNCYTCDKAIHA